MYIYIIIYIYSICLYPFCRIPTTPVDLTTGENNFHAALAQLRQSPTEALSWTGSSPTCWVIYLYILVLGDG